MATEHKPSRILQAGSPGVQEHFKRFDLRFGLILAAGAYALAGGALTLLGWTLASPRLTDWVNSGISMFPNPALCAIVSGAALLILSSNHAGQWRRNTVRILALFAAVIGGLTLFEHLSGLNLGIDTLLFNRPWGQRAAAAPMRMGPPASTSFLILGVGLILATRGPRARLLASVIALGSVAISSLSLIGYWFGSDQLYTVVHLTGISFQMSTILAALGIGLMAALPEHGLVYLLSRDDAGGMLIRRLLLPIIAIPLLVGWLRLLGERAGLYDTGFGLSMLLLTIIAMLMALLGLTASRISRAAQATKYSRDQLEAEVIQRKLLENQLRQRVEELAEADCRKNEFLATLAHELRNPLAPIRNSLQILRMTETEDQGTTRIQEIMERQVNHMVRLVDDLLEVSRITSGKIELRKESVEIATVLRSALETSKPLIDAGGHQLVVALPPEPLTVEADPVRLSQVVANLLNNAAKYTDPGGDIRLAATRENREVVVSVRDTGVGVSAAMLSQMFRMFVQADKDHKRAQGGLGIGLALAKSLVEMHGGRIEARSAGEGRGSEFIIRLPLAERQQSAKTDAASDRLENRISTRGRVLVVDDNRDAADALAALLRRLGSEVETANNGPAALEAIQSFRPSVVLLDLGMPGMSGYEVAQRARGLPGGQELILVAVTGWGQEDDRRRTREAGFNHHFVKPVEIGILQDLIAEIQDQKAVR
jgi:signal transduction histidine kinase/ActR/RegA family two-component response regulator